MSKEDKTRGLSGETHHPSQPPQYGTFQGVANYPPPQPQPVTGFPQPVPPRGATEPSAPPPPPPYYADSYQTVQGKDMKSCLSYIAVVFG